MNSPIWLCVGPYVHQPEPVQRRPHPRPVQDQSLRVGFQVSPTQHKPWRFGWPRVEDPVSREGQRGSPALATTGLTALAMLAFAANSLLCRAALAGGHADAPSFTTLRLAGGALTLGLVARWQGRAFPSSRFAWGSAVALFGYAIGFSLAYLRISAGAGALLLFGAVQLTMVGAGLRAGERPRALEWAGHALSVAGLVVLTWPGLERPDPLGALLMLGAGAAWGVSRSGAGQRRTPWPRTRRASPARSFSPSGRA